MARCMKSTLGLEDLDSPPLLSLVEPCQMRRQQQAKLNAASHSETHQTEQSLAIGSQVTGGHIENRSRYLASGQFFHLWSATARLQCLTNHRHHVSEEPHLSHTQPRSIFPSGPIAAGQSISHTLNECDRPMFFNQWLRDASGLDSRLERLARFQ